MRISIFSIVLCLVIPSISVASYVIKLKNGRKISAQYYWKESGKIFFHIYGGSVGIPSDRIESICKLHEEETANNGEKTTISKEINLPEKKARPRTKIGKDEASTDYYKKRKIELIKMLKIQYKKLKEAISKGKEHRIERRKIKIEEIRNALNRLTKEVMDKNNGVLPSWWKEL